nr:di-N-acetylchitobiase-like [Lytechinus pictus]
MALLVPHVLFSCMVLILSLSASVNGVDYFRRRPPCHCSDATLCDPIKTTPKKEIHVFSVDGPNWKDYFWDNITTVAVQEGFDPELLCHAHSKGVRVTVWGYFSVQTLFNESARNRWVEDTVNYAVNNFIDGYNIDFEFPLLTSQAPTLTAMIKQTKDAFKKALPYSVVTLDSSYSSNCTLFGRCYDYLAISKIVDYIVIMAYDELDLIGLKGMANAPLNRTRQGIDDFLKAGVSPSKLVVAVPWYGYDFTCAVLNEDDICYYKLGGWRELQYRNIMKLLANNSTTGRKWSKEYESPYFDYKDMGSGETHQLWYDDPTSLALRYQLAAEKQLYGVSVYHADNLDYSTNKTAVNETNAMWDAFVREY